jgi:hypothetical protein
MGQEVLDCPRLADTSTIAIVDRDLVDGGPQPFELGVCSSYQFGFGRRACHDLILPEGGAPYPGSEVPADRVLFDHGAVCVAR